MTAQRDKMIFEEASIACGKRRDALFFVCFLLEQIALVDIVD